MGERWELSYIKNRIRFETKQRLLFEGKHCQSCGQVAECIHHLVYRWKPKPEDIQYLCKKCHQKIPKYHNDKVVIEDNIKDIDMEGISELYYSEKEFFEQIKKLDCCICVPELSKRMGLTKGIVERILKKLHHNGMLTAEDGRNPIIYNIYAR